MSFSFSVPATPSADFPEAAAKAKVAYESSLEGNDYGLTQLASGLADKAIKAATDLIADMGPGTAAVTISGHYADDGKSASNVAVNVNVTPAASA